MNRGKGEGRRKQNIISREDRDRREGNGKTTLPKVYSRQGSDEI